LTSSSAPPSSPTPTSPPVRPRSLEQLQDLPADPVTRPAERQNIKVVISDPNLNPAASHNPYLLTPQQEAELRNKQSANSQRLQVPRRPAWTRDMTTVELERQERDAFLEWRRGLAECVLLRSLLPALLRNRLTRDLSLAACRTTRRSSLRRSSATSRFGASCGARSSVPTSSSRSSTRATRSRSALRTLSATSSSSTGPRATATTTTRRARARTSTTRARARARSPSRGAKTCSSSTSPTCSRAARGASLVLLPSRVLARASS